MALAAGVMPTLPRLARVARFWIGVIAPEVGAGAGEMGTGVDLSGALRRTAGAMGTGVDEVTDPEVMGGD